METRSNMERERQRDICNREGEKCYLSRLIGIQVSIDKMSKKMDTISLEIFHWTSGRKVDQSLEILTTC